jgi:hypothetical protein
VVREDIAQAFASRRLPDKHGMVIDSGDCRGRGPVSFDACEHLVLYRGPRYFGGAPSRGARDGMPVHIRRNVAAADLAPCWVDGWIDADPPE